MADSAYSLAKWKQMKPSSAARRATCTPTSAPQRSQHEVVDHAVQYVDGKVHTNGLEKFWSLVKRGLNGTYISVEPFHLFRYLDEHAFRYNSRKMNDGERFDIMVRQIVGKRLTWDQLTGKADAQEV